jgi:hypothetical protein
MLLEAKHEVAVKSAVLLSLNGVDVMLEQWDGAIRRGEIRWDYCCYIAFDLDKNEGIVCLNGEKHEATPYSPDAFSFRLDEHLVRWRISNAKDGSLLTLMFWDDEGLQAMLVVTVTGDHTGVEMCNSLLRCLNRLTTAKIIGEGGKSNDEPNQ